MAILADTIKKLLTKAGFDLNSETYRQLIGIKELVAEIPDEVDQSLTTLMGLTEAKNNIDIKKHFKAEALDPFNNKVGGWLKEYGADDDTIKSISEDPNTYNKIETAIKKIAELKSKGGENKSDKAELERKINELSAALSKAATDAATDKANAVAQLVAQYDGEFTEMEINRILGSKPLPGQFGVDVETKIAREFLNKKLAEKNATIKKIDGKLKIVAKDDNKMLIFDNGKELDLDTLTDMALADNKFLKVSGNGGGQPPQPTPNPQGSPKQSAAAADALSELDIALQGFVQK
jgi:hypothetical protein